MPSPRQIFARHALPALSRLALWWRGTGGPAHLLLEDPPVLHVLYWTNRPDPLAFLDPLQELLRNGPLHILCSFSWDMDPPQAIRRLERVHLRRTRRFRRHAIHYLATTPAQVEQLSARGISAILCSPAALVDEALYHPIPGITRRFDAIYDARLAPFKRHQLAEKIENLALLTAVNLTDDDATYARDIRARLAHAHWCNPPFAPAYRSLPPAEVNLWLNRARVGLCLSAVEGAMYASMQYLLAGLPVVSTPSAGGRDLFYEPAYAAIVQPEPAAVAEGVRRMTSCPIPPQEIRARTLERVRLHRARLVDLVDRICREAGKPRQFAHDWPRVFINQLAPNHAPFAPILGRISKPPART